MNKKNVFLLVCGTILYFIGFVWLSILAKASMMIGGILLSVFFVKTGREIKNKRKILGNAMRLFGQIFFCIIIIVFVGIIISEFA